jgi:hypothetical protein
MIIFIDALLFDGTTLPPATAQLDLQANGTYLYSDGGQPFAALGSVPWSAIKAAVGGNIGRVLYAKSSSLATTATVSLLLDNKIMVAKTWNPAQQITSVGFPVTAPQYSIGISTNHAVGLQTFTMDIIPLDDDDEAVALQTAEAIYGADDAAPRDVPSRVVGPLIAAQTVAAGDFVLYDTSAGAFALKLPAAPESGDAVTFKEVADSAVNALTIDGNGNNVEIAAGGTAATNPYQIASGFISYRFIGSGTWLIENIRV